METNEYLKLIKLMKQRKEDAYKLLDETELRTTVDDLKNEESDFEFS